MCSAQRLVSVVVFLAIAVVLSCLTNPATAGLINTYSGPGPYTSNITSEESSVYSLNQGYKAVGMVNGGGFFGTAPNFTDSDSDGFPDHKMTPGPGFPTQTEWFTGPGGGGATFDRIDHQTVSFNLPYTGTGTYVLDSMRLWNHNESGGKSTRGVQNAYIWYSNVDRDRGYITAWAVGGSSPGADWTLLRSQVFTKGTESDTYDGESYSLSGITARHILIDVENNWAGVSDGTDFVGLKEVQFFGTYVIPEPSTLALLTTGLLGLLCYAWRKRK